MAVTTYTHGGTANQPFGSATGIKMIDGFAASNLPTIGPVDPWTGVQLYLVNQVKMYMGGTAATAGASRLGLWNSAGSYYQVANQTINGVAATVSSTVALEAATLNAVIQSGKTYYAGGWATASLASKRDTATGSFSSYTGNGISTTVGTTYNPGNLYFQILYYYLPAAPTGVTAVANTSSPTTSIDLSWTAPVNDGGTPVTGYRIDISTDGTNYSTYSHGTYSATPATTATITGLKPGATYYFKVAAKNGVVPGFGINGTNGTAGTYTDTSAAWSYDGFSSGPLSAASTSLKLKGGVYNGTTYVPTINSYVATSGTQTASTMSIGSFTQTGTLTLPSVTGIRVGDYILIKNAANSIFNISAIGYTISAIDSVNKIVTYNSGYFNGTSTPVTSASASVTTWAVGSVKAYSGGWKSAL